MELVSYLFTSSILMNLKVMACLFIDIYFQLALVVNSFTSVMAVLKGRYLKILIVLFAYSLVSTFWKYL